MYEESKRLLSLFGVPYIVAPAEAEAQCAQLETSGLVDGVVTEDNDTFLFGGRHVYKNLFDPNRHVECYHMDDVEAELSVDRRKMIDLALLLGSDYTDGVHGVGIVNAMEIVTSFDEDAGGLEAFGKWARSWSEGTEATEEVHPRVRAYKRKHKAMRRGWVLSEGFPSAQVSRRRPVAVGTFAPLAPSPTRILPAAPVVDVTYVTYVTLLRWSTPT